MGEAGAEEAEDVFVEEVEVPEAVYVAGSWVIAYGMALVGIGDACEDMPRRSDGEKKQTRR